MIVTKRLPSTENICVLSFALLLSGCRQQQPNATAESSPSYQLPQECFLDAKAERDIEGATRIVGSTNLPDGLKIGVEILSGKQTLGQDFDVFVKSGHFQSAGFTLKGRPYPAGKKQVHFLNRFNDSWQSRDLLALVGDGGKNLQGKIFTRTDPDVIDSDKQLDYTLALEFPALTPEMRAVDLVKTATLTVPEQGRSATDIEENLKLFMQPGGGVQQAKDWSAQKASGSDTYSVSFDFIDGSRGEQQAIWSVDLASHKVEYVNKYAKMFSWTPR